MAKQHIHTRARTCVNVFMYVVAPVTGIICLVAHSLTGRPVDKRALITVTRYKHTACQSKTATTPVTLLSRSKNVCVCVSQWKKKGQTNGKHDK